MAAPNRPPLQPVTSDSGTTLGWCSAADATTTALLADVIRRCATIDRLQRQRQQAIRDGLIPPCPWDATDRHWISDRH